MKGYLIEDDDLEIAMKVIIVGNGCVGKSSMIQRFCRGVFTRDYKKTIGVDFLERVLNIDGHTVRLMLWDTAGQEEFDAITRTYYRGASACVLTCSITDRNSFNALPIWKNKVCRECGDSVPMILVANKYDLQKQAVIDSSDLEEMAKTLGITKVFRTSVKEDLNILTVFTQLAQDYLTSYLALDEYNVNDLDGVNDLLEGDNFLATIDSLSLVSPTDKPHHKFHTPVFNFRTNNNPNNNILHKNNKNKGHKVKLVTNGKCKGKSSKVKGYPEDKSLLPFRNLTRTTLNPVILRTHSGDPQGSIVDEGFGIRALSPSRSKHNLNYRKVGGQKDAGSYFFSSSGNHYTHWENMPFRLDAITNRRHCRKQKRDFCSIL